MKINEIIKEIINEDCGCGGKGKGKGTGTGTTKNTFIYEYESVNKDMINESSSPERTKSGKLSYRGETFLGYNKPKRYSGKGKYKYRVLAKDGDEIKIVNFGHRDYSDYTKHKDPDRRRNFRKRHGCDPVKNLKKTTARYWACQYLW